MITYFIVFICGAAIGAIMLFVICALFVGARAEERDKMEGKNED